MATQRWQAKDFQGFTPAVESRRSNEIYAVGGKNFLFDSIGPKSIFGEDLLTPIGLVDARWIQGARLKLRGGDRVFYFVPTGIIEWDEVQGNWRVLWITENTGETPYRWTWGYLNEWVFFCHPAIGVLAYNPFSGVIQTHNPDGFPADPLAICVTNGRLCIIDPVFFTFSNPSDGFSFDPQLGGAGLYKISDSVAGFPTMVTSYPGGALTWTTGGVMRSEFTGDQLVFRHRPVNTEYRLVNSFCSVKIDDNTCVILDERGLFQSRGEAPTPWTPLFNEFFIEYARRLKLRIGENVRLEWDELQRHLYVSISQSFENPIYEYAFVLYPSLDKWGILNRSHFGIFPGRIEQSLREGDYYGFAGDDARIRLWRDSGYREIQPDDTTVDLWVPEIEWPVQPTAEGRILSSAYSPTSIDSPHPLGRAGWYPPGSGPSAVPAPPGMAGLDAKLVVGLLRFDDLQGSNDEMTEVTQLAIGSVLTGEIDPDRTDWNLPPSGTADEDWGVELGQEDWGIEPINFTDHGVRMTGSVDGRTSFVSEVPSLVLTQQGIRYFSCSVTGVWHLLELSASEPGQRFHLQSFELTATYAGKLN